MKKYPFFKGPRRTCDMQDFLAFVAESYTQKPAFSYRTKPSDKESQVISFEKLHE